MATPLMMDIYRDGAFDNTWPIRTIAHEIAGFTRHGWTVRETVRTRHCHDSRFHVYLFWADDPTMTATLVFRYSQEG